MKNIRKTIYLDYAASTPLDGGVLNVMKPFLLSAYGNPSSLHHKGIEARNAIEKSRKIVADLIGARAEEIVFTGGGTEACNLAIFGAADGIKPGHIITTQIEHHAVLEPIKELQRRGWKATFLPVDREGFIKVDDFKKAVRKDTALVSVMYANNEIGVIEPIIEIGRILRAQNAKRKAQKIPEIIFHTDACQATGSLDINVNRLQINLMSVSASKIYGPKGAGFLYVRTDTSIYPIICGGGQERGLRSGTENVPGIVGMAKALELAVKLRDSENSRLTGLRDYAVWQIKKALPRVFMNGPQIEKISISSKLDGRHEMRISQKLRINQKLERLPNNINVTIPGVEGESLLLYLDATGICVSTGSACATGSTDASHVLRAIGRTEKQAKESVRITLGRATKKKDLDYLIKSLKKAILLILDER